MAVGHRWGEGSHGEDRMECEWWCWPFPGDDLMRCVDLYNQAQSKWFEEMVTTTLVSDRRCVSVSIQGRTGAQEALGRCWRAQG